MGSVKFKDLKAYVRYDGSGRVVAGSLVFRKKKPKNGRWQEISSNLCCNPNPIPNPSTTTTTTTSGGGGGAVGVPYTVYVGNLESACAGNNPFTLYFQAPWNPTNGATAYYDQALTNRAAYMNVIVYGGTHYSTDGLGVMQYQGPCGQTTTTTTTQSLPAYVPLALTAQEACSQQGIYAQLLSFDSPYGLCAASTVTFSSDVSQQFGVSNFYVYYQGFARLVLNGGGGTTTFQLYGPCEFCQS